MRCWPPWCASQRPELASALDRLIRRRFAVPQGRAAARDLPVQACPGARRGLWHAAAPTATRAPRSYRRHPRKPVRRHRRGPARSAGAALHRGGLIDKAAALWGKAGLRSWERSALVEAVEQLTRALAQIATLPATPALRREQIKLQVALVNPLMHVKGYAAPETKAAAEQARLLIEQAEALGRASRRSAAAVLGSLRLLERKLCRVQRRRDPQAAAQFLALAEKQSATFPLMIGHRLMGTTLVFTGDFAQAGRTSITRSRFTILSSIVRWRRVLAKTSGSRSCAIDRWLCGRLAILRPRSRSLSARSGTRARSAMRLP